ncbi:MAG TPA: sensor histidine kinase [Pyrinomonadaceae bacterium]|nr:sensor histidine kinase [Pyrinomonadaceae bacterium]
MIQLNNSTSKFRATDAVSDAALREVAVRLITAQEEERSRMAREIHDDLGQKLALLSLELGQLGQQIDASGAVQTQFQNLQNQIEEISTDVHRLAYKLHPAKLDHIGLVAAIRGLAYELTATGKLRVEFHRRGAFSKLPKELTLCLFRIAQEALRNSLVHSGTASARVFLINTGNEVRLSVSDDGCGFDINADEHGLGLTSMRERATIVGGTIMIRSVPASGTVVEVAVPLDGIRFVS